MEQLQQKDEIRIPWGTGIVGYVAESRKSLNISDCYKDDRFNRRVDRKTGYTTRNMLCMPILDADGEVKGVAQIINKCGGREPFTDADEKIFSQHLQFCGFGLHNAELYERSELGNKRNHILLDLAHMIFKEQSTIENIVFKIMAHAQSLLKCEKCQILLVAENTKKFSRVFDLDFNGMKTEDAESRKGYFGVRFPINMGIAGYVASTGATLNIPDVRHDDRYDSSVDGCDGFHPCSVLCMPIRNAYNKIIGVCQLTNKLNGTPFNKSDERLFETFAIFYGMGIENTRMHEKASRAITKAKVRLEVLSYHTTSPFEKTKDLNCIVPSIRMYRLEDLKFKDFRLDNENMLKTSLRMFMDLNLIERFCINYDVLHQWLSIETKNYRPVAYHNSRHAFNLSQMMFAFLMITKLWHAFGEVETLSLLIACLCYHLDHRGTDNSSQLKSCSTLAQLYSTSAMEHRHFDQFIMLLNSEVNQILNHMSPDEYSTVVHVVEHAILATDLVVYFQAMLMTVTDIAAITKPWEIQRVGMTNRDKKNELPSIQVRFIESICVPVYEAFAKISDKLKPLLDGVKQNEKTDKIKKPL